MYIVNKKYSVRRKKLIDKSEILGIRGFLLSSRTKIFKICDADICNIQVVDKKLAHPIVSSLVLKKYNRLINQLLKLLVDSDDETGDNYRQVLDRIEKFRLQIKNKYRAFLKKQELARMSKQLTLLKKQAMEQFLEVQNSYYQEIRSFQSRGR